jgi:squalene-hopene/tetraprenyl-beta-curcumene cyclase
VAKAIEFLVKSVRPDGSWPIDTNLSTWVTTLSVNALAAADDLEALDRKEELRDWLLRQQYKERHPYTGADPGAWAWTPLPGGVPDADDTPGAILALRNLGVPIDRNPGLGWLLRLQNRDRGWPTFCRGWTGLPFDRSGSDLTGHVLRALASCWGGKTYFVDIAIIEGVNYLSRAQRPDGSWLPLWFGNQHAPDDINPTYGTSRVLAAYRDLGTSMHPNCPPCDRAWLSEHGSMNSEPARRGVAWLTSAQNADGGWGGDRDTPSSVEETALALDALLGAIEASREGEAPAEPQSKGSAGASPSLSHTISRNRNAASGVDSFAVPVKDAVNKGLAWLVQKIEFGAHREPTPIGFYFARLWYFERLYPIIFSVAALGRARRVLSSRG